MAIVVQSTASTGYTAATSVVITKPTGLAVGDLLVAIIGATSGTSGTIATASGWTSLADTGSSSLPIKIQWKIADSSDVAASNFTFTGTTVSRMGGALLRVTGHAAVGTSGGNDTDAYNSTTTTTISFTSTLTPSQTGCLILMGLQARNNNDGGTTLSGYNTTPSMTWTEVIDTTADAGTDDPVFGGAYAIYSGTSQITQYGATLASTKSVHTGALGIIVVAIDASGTVALLSADADQFAPTASAGTSGNSALHLADADNFATSGKSTRPAVWTNVQKGTPNVWTNINKP